MKVTKISLLIFLFTLGIGCTIGFVTNYLKAKEQSESNKVTSEQITIEQKSEKIKINSDKEFGLKVFNVDRFWDELENKANKHLLELGEVSNGKDFKIKYGETWLGLYGNYEDTQLLPSEIRVSHKFELGMDWTVFSTKTKNEPLFLVKNLKGVKQGKVKTLFRGLTWDDYDKGRGDLTSLRNGFEKEYKLDGKAFVLRVEDGVDEKQEHIWALTLETDGNKQIIYYISYSGDEAEVGNLYWVGDLDSDGKPDFFMDFYNYEKGGYSSGIFLSSQAEKGKLVKLFEYFRLSAC